MIPPPTTISLFGISGRARAPVEDTIFFSSIFVIEIEKN